MNNDAGGKSALSEGLGPLVEELAHRTAWRYAHSQDPHHSHTYTFNRTCLMAFAEKLQAAERERCAKLCEKISEGYERREGRKHAEMKTDAQTGANDCMHAILGA